MSIFTKGIHKAAYSGSLSCPVCESQAIRFVENLGATRLRYRCRKCGLPFQYEISGRPNIHPYAPLKKSKWQGIVDQFNRKVESEKPYRDALEKLH